MAYGKSKMPNEGGGKKGGGAAKTNTGASTGLRKSNEMRSDVTQKPSNKNPYPRGMS